MAQCSGFGCLIWLVTISFRPVRGWDFGTVGPNWMNSLGVCGEVYSVSLPELRPSDGGESGGWGRGFDDLNGFCDDDDHDGCPSFGFRAIGVSEWFWDRKLELEEELGMDSM